MFKVRIGTPTIGEIREGEITGRYIDGTGLVLYTKYRNQIYSAKMHPSSTPPIIDKKMRRLLNNSNFISINQTTGSLEIDYNSLIDGDIADGDSLLFIDSSSSYTVKKEALSDLAALLAGGDLTATNSVLAIDDSFLRNDANDETLFTIGVGQLDVDNITINGNTITSTDTNGNLVLSANGTGVIDIDDTLDVDGIAYLDDMKFDSNIIEVIAENNLKLLPNGALLIDTYPATLSNNYAITNTADIYHFMSGQNDFKQNLSFLAIHNESTDFETYPAGR